MNIKPFNGMFFNENLVRLSDVVTLPYDKITAEKRESYAKKSPYNMVHLILPKDHNEAADFLEKWLKDDVLKKDSVPALYVYEQEYEHPKGVKKKRIGLVASLELKPFGKDTVMPHEQTFSKVKEDRKGLLSACKANFGQIFLLYADPEKRADKLFLDLLKSNPSFELKDEFDIVHRVWKISDYNIIKSIQDNLKEFPLFIADGHHRYSSALMYKDHEQKKIGDKYTGKEDFNYRMVTIVNVDASDLTILPTHRVLKGLNNIKPEWLISELEKYFIIETVNVPTTELLNLWLGSISNVNIPHVLGMYMGGDNYYTLKLKTSVSLQDILDNSRPKQWLYLDVNILHLLIMKNIMDIDTHNAEDEGNILYLRDAFEAIDCVKKKNAEIAFILNPTKIEEVKEIVELGEVMPHKSTDFYPKLHTGLVMRKLD